MECLPPDVSESTWHMGSHPRAFRQKTEESHGKKCQYIRSLGKQEGWITVWGPELKLIRSHTVQIMTGNATDLLSFLRLFNQVLFLSLFQQHSQMGVS